MKFKYAKGCPVSTELSYPIRNLDSDYGSMVSVVRGRDDYDIGTPTPVGDSTQVDLFLSARHQTVAGLWPADYFEHHGIDGKPSPLFERFGVTADNPRAAAQLVNHSMDHPLDLHNLFVDLYGIPKTIDIGPEYAGKPFLPARVWEAEVAKRVAEALIEVFQLKYAYGQARPEEYFPSGVLVAEYPCPEHPAFGAGHAVIDETILQMWLASGAIDQHTHEATTAARQKAHYRTLAGVHWPEDNEAGAELARRKLGV